MRTPAISPGRTRSNLAQLHENAQANGVERRKSPAREGPALLQGLVICGRCGERMTVRYYCRHGLSLPEYVCQKRSIENGESPCQRLLGADLDRAVGELLVETVTPLALEAALAVHDELQGRAEQADNLRRLQVERARYEAELAQRRFLRVDPDNRLVASSLEAEWNCKLRALNDARDECEQRREADGTVDDRHREQILSLATDFPRLWKDPAVPMRERKRMIRLLVDDVTLLRTDEIVAHVRFRGGATHTVVLALPLNAAELRKVDPAVVAEADRLLDEHTDAETVEILNSTGWRPGVAERFSPRILYLLRRTYGLGDRFTRLRRRGLLTLAEISELLGGPSRHGESVGAGRPYSLLRLQRQGPAALRATVSDATALPAVRRTDSGNARASTWQEAVQPALRPGGLSQPQT